ncbi:MAG: MMPL family transporter [Candidatus Nanopelagicales bacterium]
MSKSKVKGRRPLWLAVITVVAWLLVSAGTGPLFGQLSTVQENDNSAFLPESAESTIASDISNRFVSDDSDQLPALMLFSGEITPSALQEIGAYLAALPSKTIPGTSEQVADFLVSDIAITPIPSPDGKAVLASLPLDNQALESLLSNGEEALPAIVEFIREDAEGLAGLEFHVTGIGGILADFFGAFGEIDTTLLQTTLLVVALILIVVYRSPFLWILPLASALFALTTAGGIVYLLAKNDILDLNGQSQGILFVLVIGAATDYALLLIARYREELHHHETPYQAMRVAWRGVFEPILASGSTVVAGLMVLLVSELSSNRGLGPVGSVGIIVSMATQLTLLPALLVLFGRKIFWPKIPKFDDVDERLSGFWSKIANLVGVHPKRVWISTGLLLSILAGFATQLNTDGIPFSESFTERPDSVIGQEKLQESFPGGQGQPTVVLVPVAKAAEVTQRLEDFDGIESVVPTLASPVIPGQPLPEPKIVDGLIQLEATLSFAADSVQSRDLIPGIRTAVKEIDPAILVGGTTAIGYDTDQASSRDVRVIIPIVLFVIGIILAMLLRSLLGAALLLVTVVLSFSAALGASHLVFTYLLDFPATDAAFPLFAFVFLVALGIDYNIFLMTRVREEAIKIGTRPGITKGLTVTGGVITSAGVVLASTFAVLGVLPLVFLAQLGFIVAFGVLLDALIVRSLLVPAIAHQLGGKVWWPSKLWRNEKASA